MPSNDQLVSTSEAARIIGCSPQHVRTLIRTGKLTAVSVKTTNGSPTGTEWRVTIQEANRYRKYQPKRGWKRGDKRK